MNLRTFFKVTGVILLVVAAGLFAFSVHELQEAGWFPFLETHAFELTALPDDEGIGAVLRGLLGYNADPTVLEVIAWVAYLVVIGALYLRPVVATEPRRSVAVDATNR